MTEDATKVAPHVYKVVFENERARVLEVRMKPGESTTRHSHPDYVVYVLSGGKVEIHARLPGKAAKRSFQPALACGGRRRSTPPRTSGRPKFTRSSSSRNRGCRRILAPRLHCNPACAMARVSTL